MTRVLELRPTCIPPSSLPADAVDSAAPLPRRATLEALLPNGQFAVRVAGSPIWTCDMLLPVEGTLMAMEPGDSVLVLPPASGEPGVVLGRIGRYTPPQPQATVTMEATESLTLKCGEASLEMRADGKVMLKGDDVLIRAKGTQRIRAGNVAIN